MAGPKRPQDRIELAGVKDNFLNSAWFTAPKSAKMSVNRHKESIARRRGCHRGHHQLHQYVEPIRDGGRRTARQESR